MESPIPNGRSGRQSLDDRPFETSTVLQCAVPRRVLVKATLRKFTQLGPVKAVVRCMLFAADGLSRLISVLRTAAIFPGPELPFCHWSVTVKYPENVLCGAQVVIG